MPVAMPQPTTPMAGPPSAGSPGVFYPGELEHLREIDRRRDGIAVEEATWAKLRELATGYGQAEKLAL